MSRYRNFSNGPIPHATNKSIGISEQTLVITLIGLALGMPLGSRIGKAAKVLAGPIFVFLGLLIIIETFGNRDYI